jgi:4-diphosphocytidyl-2-C-methyl-D-erythritol kinase
MKIDLSAPAKINLSLRVLRRRPDGYHEISTRMAALELADTLTIESASTPGIQFSCSDASLPADGTNLAFKAALELERLAGRPLAAAIHLHKRIPHGAGLGGGSSDAATVLRGLNRLLRLGLTDAALLDAAAKLGSDVPFFLRGGWCECAGRGEIVHPLPGSPPPWRILLLKPPFGVPTPWAYQNWIDSREIPGVLYAEQRLDGIALVNDLERPVFEKHLVLADMKMWLLGQAGVRGALMSGSGSTVFAVLADEADAGSLTARFREQFGADVWASETRLAPH